MGLAANAKARCRHARVAGEAEYGSATEYTVAGKKIAGVVAGHTPHRMAWYYGQPATYSALLAGKTIGQARALGSMVEVTVEDAIVLFGEGVGARFSFSSRFEAAQPKSTNCACRCSRGRSVESYI